MDVIETVGLVMVSGLWVMLIGIACVLAASMAAPAASWWWTRVTCGVRDTRQEMARRRLGLERLANTRTWR